MPNTYLTMFFVLFAPEDKLVAAFADANDAINYVLTHEETYGFVPNDDFVITDWLRTPKLSVLVPCDGDVWFMDL